MRLITACTVTSAEVVGKLPVRDFIKNLVTHPGRRQALRDPFFRLMGGSALRLFGLGARMGSWLVVACERILRISDFKSK